MKHSYQAEKFSSARRALMLPHPQGEAKSIAAAFHECDRGLAQFNRNQLDQEAKDWLVKLDKLMNTSGLNDPQKKGLWQVKAETLSESERLELSHIVDELAHRFDDEWHDDL